MFTHKDHTITRYPQPTTHEGAVAVRLTPLRELRRTVMACLLWEDSFYESGMSVADRIRETCAKLSVKDICEVAIEARQKQKLRHVPLWLLVQAIARQTDSHIVGRSIPQIVQRPDEMGELIALYWKDGKKPLTRQMKIGLANAFKSFNEYELAKYDRDTDVKSSAWASSPGFGWHKNITSLSLIAAARAVPEWSDLLEPLMLKCLSEIPKLPGKTLLVVDNSGSMYGVKVSARSDIERADAAAALAVLVRSVCEETIVVAFSTDATIVPNYQGFALMDAIRGTPIGNTDTGRALAFANAQGYDRVIVITDEQSHTHIPDPLTSKAYFINVAQYKNRIGYGKWVRIDGWSESVLDYIVAYESE